MTKLFRYFFTKNRNAIEVGVIGSTAMLVVFTIAISALGAELTSATSQLATIAMSVLGYLVFVELHHKFP